MYVIISLYSHVYLKKEGIKLKVRICVTLKFSRVIYKYKRDAQEIDLFNNRDNDYSSLYGINGSLAVENKTAVATKTPIKNKTQRTEGRVSKIPRLETVNVKQLKPLLEQKADPLRALELANLWTRPRGILKPFQSDLLILHPPPKFDDEDETAEVDEVSTFFIHPFIHSFLFLRLFIIGLFFSRSTPRSFCLFGGL